MRRRDGGKIKTGTNMNRTVKRDMGMEKHMEIVNKRRVNVNGR